MKVQISYGQIVGSIVKAGIVGIASVVVGPEAAISTAMLENIAEVAGETISGIHMKQDLREKIRQMMRDSLEEAFVQVEKPQAKRLDADDVNEDESTGGVAEKQEQDHYGVVPSRVKDLLYDMLFREEELSLEMNDSLVSKDGKQLFHNLVMRACVEYEDEVDI